MKVFMSLALLFSFGAKANSIKKSLRLSEIKHCAVPSDLNKISIGLDKIQNRPRYDLVPGILAGGIAEVGETLSPVIYEIMDQVSEAAFGRKGVVKVIGCKRCPVRWYGLNMGVGMPTNFESWLRSFLTESEIVPAMTFTLAHEVGHYLQNLMYKELYPITPFLSDSTYRLSPAEADTQKQLIQIMISSQEHAEVDSIAFLLLERMGVSKEPGIKLLAQINKEVVAKHKWKESKKISSFDNYLIEEVNRQADARIRLSTASAPEMINSTLCFKPAN